MKRIIISIFALVGIVISCFVYASCDKDQTEVKPFENLQMSEIESIAVIRYKKEYVLDETEREELLRILNSITTYGEFPESDEIIGELQEHFTLKKKDGSELVVSFFYPNVKINGTHYITDEDQARLGEDLYERICQEQFPQ